MVTVGLAAATRPLGASRVRHGGIAMRSILALALSCAATMKASAQYPNGYFVDGNALMAWCEPHNATGPSNALCIGYVAAAVSDAVNFSRQFTGQGPSTKRHAVPGHELSGSGRGAQCSLHRNPDKRNLAAAALVVAAMDEAWCPQAPAAPNVHFKAHQRGRRLLSCAGPPPPEWKG